MITRPLLAVTLEDLNEAKYPVYATPKLDGIRCLKVDGKVVTRKFKELPNRFIRTVLENILVDGLDGEIMIPGASFNETQSQVMRFEGEPVFEFHVFDYVKSSLDKSYLDRIEDLKAYHATLDENAKKRIKLLIPTRVDNVEELSALEAQYLEQNFEGVMIRTGEGKYKCGRSTLKEGILLKIKQFQDSEAEIIGFQEKLKNENEKERDEFGLAKRSSKKEGLVAAGTLGAIVVRDLKTKQEFQIGSGFDDKLRKEIFDNKEDYLGRIVNYQFQPHGQKELPRFPTFRGIRSPLDMSN